MVHSISRIIARIFESDNESNITGHLLWWHILRLCWAFLTSYDLLFDLTASEPGWRTLEHVLSGVPQVSTDTKNSHICPPQRSPHANKLCRPKFSEKPQSAVSVTRDNPPRYLWGWKRGVLMCTGAKPGQMGWLCATLGKIGMGSGRWSAYNCEEV